LQPDIAQQCREVLLETQLSNLGLNVEVTESAMIANPKARFNRSPAEIPWIKIALDDLARVFFLSYLHRFRSIASKSTVPLLPGSWKMTRWSAPSSR
jgi:EAL domain-containing protein (putative c-di-GMP-specific phosphodiesterase class I)